MNNFFRSCASVELPRLRPHRFHTRFAGNSRGYPQCCGDNLFRALRLNTALAQGALEKARRIDLVSQFALDGPGLAFQLRRD